jgi:hypothetical protein
LGPHPLPWARPFLAPWSPTHAADNGTFPHLASQRDAIGRGGDMAKTIEGRSRLVCLAYQVLNKIDVEVAGKTDGELVAVMAAAFRAHAAEFAEAEQSQCPPRQLKLREALTRPHTRAAAFSALEAHAHLWMTEGLTTHAT